MIGVVVADPLKGCLNAGFVVVEVPTVENPLTLRVENSQRLLKKYRRRRLSWHRCLQNIEAAPFEIYPDEGPRLIRVGDLYLMPRYAVDLREGIIGDLTAPLANVPCLPGYGSPNVRPGLVAITFSRVAGLFAKFSMRTFGLRVVNDSDRIAA